jgi:hypothetical protein
MVEGTNPCKGEHFLGLDLPNCSNNSSTYFSFLSSLLVSILVHSNQYPRLLSIGTVFHTKSCQN